MTDQYHHWRLALQGSRIETERGSPRSGFFKRTTNKPEPQHIEAVCIYRDEAGALQCIRNVFGDGSRMDADAIDELFGEVCIYPISHEQYQAVTERSEPWPPEYGSGGRLTLKDQQAGVAWTPEYGRKRLGLDMPGATAAAPPPIGHNMPPSAIDEETPAEAPAAEPAPVGHAFDGERTPELIMTEEVSALGGQVKVWLGSIGGAPRDKAEADIAADYKTKFAALEKKADKARVDEKQPHLDAGRDVDDRWRRPISNAKASKEKCGSIAQDWRNAENARREAAAAIANKEAADAAAKASTQYDAQIDPPAPVQAERVGSLGNMRSVAERAITRWQVDDPRAYATHILAQPGDLPAEIVEALGKVASRRAEEAPGVSKHIERKAA